MSNRKAHRRERSFRRAERFTAHRHRRPGRSERTARQVEERHERRSARRLVRECFTEEV